MQATNGGSPRAGVQLSTDHRMPLFPCRIDPKAGYRTLGFRGFPCESILLILFGSGFRDYPVADLVNHR